MSRAWIEHEVADDGGTLVVHERPGAAPGAPVIVLLHGFTGCHLGWTRVAGHLPRFRILAPDLPGHGRSRFVDEGDACRMESATRRLGRALDRLGVSSFTLAGYSMGGRLALHFALAEVWRIEALVLESASPGLEADDERAARRAADDALAASIERDGVEAFLARWQETPVLASQRELRASLRREAAEERRGNRVAGLAASLRGMGTGAQLWLGDRLADLQVPVTCVAGSGDAKFAAIASNMTGRIPGASLEILPAGHNVHLEHPEAFARLLGLATDRARRKPGFETTRPHQETDPDLGPLGRDARA